VTEDRSLLSDRAQRKPCGVGAGGGILLPPGAPGYYPRENFDILDARMCILERTQRRIGIADEKNYYCS
jgi:hypothetical protein